MESGRDISEMAVSSKSPIRDMSQVPNPTSAAIAIADNIPPVSNIDVEKQPSSPDGVTTAEHTDETAGSKEVGWDGDDDPLNPQNWKSSKKWRVLAVVSVMTIITPLGSSMFAPSVPEVMRSFGATNADLGTLVVSIYVLGFAVGPVVVAPMSEIFGRLPMYMISNFMFVVFSTACAVSSSLGMLTGFRFLAGCAGAAPIALGGASIGDMFPRDRRGAAMAVWGLGPMLGPVLGPTIGGFLAEAKGWRWVFWIQVIISGVIFVLGALFLRETYAPTILEKKTHKMIKQTSDTTLRSALHDGTTPRERFKRAIIRPLKVLVKSPIVLLLSMYTAVLFGYLYLFITTFPRVFQQQYHFSTGVTGLTYLGLGVGNFVGLFIIGRTSDPLFKKLTAKNNGVAKPEFRLPPLMITCPLICISFFWYGWSADKGVHWIVPIVGTSFFGMAMMPGFTSINMYLVDTYTRYSASALAANTILRSIVGAVLPLAGQPMYDALGLGWGNSVLAFFALTFIPVPWLFFKYGERLRDRFPVRL